MSSQLGPKSQVRKFNFKSAEASASITQGRPLVFKMDGTEDGVRAVLPSSASALLAANFFAGINVSPADVVPNGYGTGQCWGFCNAVVAQQTRAASSDSFSTAAALSVGQLLTIDTVVNALIAGPTILQMQTGTASGAMGTVNLADFIHPEVVLAQTLATAAGVATTSNDTRLAITSSLKVQLRLM